MAKGVRASTHMAPQRATPAPPTSSSHAGPHSLPTGSLHSSQAGSSPGQQAGHQTTWSMLIKVMLNSHLPVINDFY